MHRLTGTAYNIVLIMESIEPRIVLNSIVVMSEIIHIALIK